MAPGHAVGFRLEAGDWVQIPVQVHCKHPAHSCVVGCKERGGLTFGYSLNSSGNNNDAFFVVLVIVSTIHGDTHYSVNKQTNNIFNLTP